MLEITNNLKGNIEAFFNRASQHGYGDLTYFPHFGKRLTEMAKIKAGESVLDVACGRGAILLPAAEKVGSLGKAIGIDLSPKMVEMTNDTLRKRGLKNAIVLHMDGEKLEFPDSLFDAVFCGFALFFFSDLPLVLAEFRRVLKPGGRLAVSTWGTDDPQWEWYENQRLAYGVTMKLMSQPLEDPAKLLEVLRATSFENFQTHIEEHDWVVPDEESWWMAAMSISTGAALEKFEPHVTEKFKQEAFKTMRAMKQVDGYHCRLQANFATCSKPF